MAAGIGTILHVLKLRIPFTRCSLIPHFAIVPFNVELFATAL